jgi:hypothetical protein
MEKIQERIGSNPLDLEDNKKMEAPLEFEKEKESELEKLLRLRNETQKRDERF